MMKCQTVEQLLLVFRSFRERYARGKPLHKAYQEAVREVADGHGVTYQTIGDGCRRRLKLNNIRELAALLGRWMEGDPEPLAKQLKAASDPSAHDGITEFFGSSATFAVAGGREARPATSNSRFDTFSLRLPERDARMARALAEIEGVSTSELLSRLVGSAVAEEMKLVAQAILHDSEAVHWTNMTREQILKILRDREAELRGLGVEHVSVFGSAARGDSRPVSDVDLTVKLKPGFSQGGFDYFGRFEALRARLAQILACPVDLVEEPVETVRLQEQIDEDRVLAF
jgi:predicted nucleotidyltransferase